MTDRYPIPAGKAQTELVILKSRFISIANYTPTVETAKNFIDQVRQTYPDASHCVYAYAIGYGSAVLHGMSNAGEPSGTAGKPTLAVVKGSGLGDVTVVTVRYFGGTKLGTGGLVKAYTESAQLVLSEIPRTEKVERREVSLTIPYHLYDRLIRLLDEHNGQIAGEDFAVEVTLKLVFALEDIPPFASALSELTSGQVEIDF